MKDLNDALSLLVAEEKIQLACAVLGKNITDYSHLDRGRQAMTGGNLLRNAIKKDEAVLLRVIEQTRILVAARPPEFSFESPKKRETTSRGASTPHDHPADVWVIKDKDVDQWENNYKEDEALRSSGKLPPRVLHSVATTTEFIYFGGEAMPKYQIKHVGRKSGSSKSPVRV